MQLRQSLILFRDGLEPKEAVTKDQLDLHAHAKLDRLPDAETSQRTVYVDPAGSDTTGDGSSANRWATIQYAVAQARALMEHHKGTSAYKIVCATGTYDEQTTIPPNLLSSFSSGGFGGIWIVSETGAKADVVITTTAGSAAILAYGSCTVQSVTLEHDDQPVRGLGSAANLIFVRDCLLRRRSLSDGGTAALRNELGKMMSFGNSSEAGRAFQYGLRALYGGVIGKVGTQPSGTVANELASHGGEIR